jgi:N6-adenosine-specific RNA methylase IME4
MTVEQIASLPVRDLAADRSHLWLWTTNGFLFESAKVFEAWDFVFKSSYVWCKRQIGIGNYLRNAHEFLLLGTRGGLVGNATDVPSWGVFDRTKHSRKPEEIRRAVIEKVSPGPYLELFGRSPIDGWTVWGDEIEGDLFNGDPKHA